MGHGQQWGKREKEKGGRKVKNRWSGRREEREKNKGIHL